MKQVNDPNDSQVMEDLWSDATGSAINSRADEHRQNSVRQPTTSFRSLVYESLSRSGHKFSSPSWIELSYDALLGLNNAHLSLGLESTDWTRRGCAGSNANTETDCSVTLKMALSFCVLYRYTSYIMSAQLGILHTTVAPFISKHFTD